jgi:undecaprenyl diphosphate synthase
MAELTDIDFSKPIPVHVAIIMDGNGRWARKNRMKTRLQGHEAGAESVRAVLRASEKIGIRYLTLYAFSTENWKRPEKEVTGLMNLLEKFLRKHTPELVEKGICLRAIGTLEDLPDNVTAALQDAMHQTRDNTERDLILALSYGGRHEITHSVRTIAEQVRSGSIQPGEITEETIAAHLYAPDVPDPDLMIRTSGELRISNFLLWQLSYTELYVTPVLWPDFRESDMYDAIAAYQSRSRRYGDIL